MVNVLSCLWDGSYKRTLILKSSPCSDGSGFPHHLSVTLPYVLIFLNTSSSSSTSSSNSSSSSSGSSSSSSNSSSNSSSSSSSNSSSSSSSSSCSSRLVVIVVVVLIVVVVVVVCMHACIQFNIVCLFVSVYYRTPDAPPAVAPISVGGGGGKVGTLKLAWQVS